MSRTQTNSEELAAQNVEYITCPFQKQLDKIIKISSALKIFHPIGQGKLLHCNCPSNSEEWRNISHLLLGQNRKVYPTFNHALKCVINKIFSRPQCKQFNSVTQSCPTLCDPMNRSTPGLPVHHQLPEFTQTHVHRVGDAIQPSHPLSSPSPPAPNPSQHQSLFQ